MSRIEFQVHRPDPGGGGGERVPSWLKEAPQIATDLKGVMNDAESSIDGVAQQVGSETESALPSVYQSVSACEATTYGTELTESLKLLGQEFGIAETRLGEYSTAIGESKEEAVNLDSQISTAISDYAEAISDNSSLPDDAEESEVQAAGDLMRSRRYEVERLQERLSEVLDEAYGLDRSYAAQLDDVTGEIQDTASRLGEITGSIRNGNSVTVALTNLTTKMETDAESMPLNDEEQAEQHAQELQEAIENGDWDEVERILAEMEVHNDNPEYAEAFTRALGPVDAAKLLEAAQELDDDEQTIRLVDVLNDTLMNGLGEYETDEMVEWVDRFADEDGDDLDVLPLLLATYEGDGRVHAYSAKYFDRVEHWPTIDYDLLQELVPGFDFAVFEEFLASATNPEALVEVLDEMGDGAVYIYAVLFPGIPHSPTEERQRLLVELLDFLGDDDDLSDTDLSGQSDILLDILEWLTGWKGDPVEYHNEAIRQFLNDPENLYYLLFKADNGGKWAEVAAKMIDRYEEAGGDPEELMNTFLDYYEDNEQFDPESAGQLAGLLLALMEQAGVDFDPTKIIFAIIDIGAARHPVASAVWGLFKAILGANSEFREQWDDFISDAKENADHSALAFFLLMADAGTMRDREGNPITEDVEEFLAEYGLDSDSLESDPEAVEEKLESLAEDPQRLQDMIDKLKQDYPDLADALRDIEQAIDQGNDPGD